MDEYLEVNRRTWNAWTRLNVASKFYDVEGFKAGRMTLDPIALAGPGDVTGRSLLHLQCHFGMDTLSWARRGAIVTGIDFSEEAITTARALSEELGIPATFVQSNLYDLPQNLTGQFDIIFTSYGVLGWLPDLERWGQIIARFLKPGGIFYIVEVHPVALLFDEHRQDAELRLLYPYFQGPEPLRDERQGSYAAPNAPVRSVTYVWIHPLAEVIGALLHAGLRIETFDEYPFLKWAFFPWMERRADGGWELPARQQSIPLMFSLKASKGYPP
ncbi:MAG TPA: class I SAM-dependent methyltransferase [Candidatus Tectomicrobia bacterium]|nr:class I SAM-dependent methyltransferase [Candidatus Tectomicrobia bacterium]